MENNEVPAGWYDDPTRPGGLRLWDGTQWTEQVRAKPVQAVPVPVVTVPVIPVPVVPVPVVPVRNEPVDAPIRYLPPAKEKRRSLIPFLLVTLAVIVCLGLIVWGAMFFFIPKPPQPTVFSAPTAEPSNTSTEMPLGDILTVEQYRSNAFVQQVEDKYRQILASPYLNLSVELVEGDVTTVFTGYHEDGYGRYVSTQQNSAGENTAAVLVTDAANKETCVRNVTKDSPDTVDADREATWKCVPYDDKEGQDYYVTMERGSPLAIVGGLSDTGE